MPADSDAIPDSACLGLSLLDIIDVQVATLDDTPKYQRENRRLNALNWDFRGWATFGDLEPYIDDTTPLFHNAMDRVVTAVLEKLPPREWKSLQLVRPRDLHFERDAHKPQRWRAHFKDRADNEYALMLTDPVATRRLEAGQCLSERSLLTVSLTRPFVAHDESMLKLCYKIAAALIEP